VIPPVLLTLRLWGNSSHMAYLESQVQQHLTGGKETLVTYKSVSHGGFLTYDGVDVNGKRICDEILTKTDQLQATGKVVKLSIIGYSLGGLISRYAIGILYTRGYFDTVTPVNFITFCSPHVGVPHPKASKAMFVYNRIAPKFLALTGDQIFLCDKVTIDGESAPLLVRLSDSNSYFFHGLSKFKYKVLYANAVNDKRCAYYTASISDIDPFHSVSNKDADRISASFIDGYAPTIVDLTKPISVLDRAQRAKEVQKTWKQFFMRRYRWLNVFLNIMIYTPFWGLTFITNSIIERVKLIRRLSAFHKDESNNFNHLYTPVKSEDRGILNAYEISSNDRVYDQKESIVESLYGAINNEVQEENLTAGDKVNLSPSQLSIVNNLNKLNWKKHAVIIRKAKTTHAAAIYRHEDPTFEEGKVVVKHFVENSFKFD